MHKTTNGLEWNFFVPFGRATGYEGIIDRLDCYDPKEIKELPKQERIDKANELVRIIREIDVFPIYYLSKEAIVAEIMNCMFEDVSFTGKTLDVQSSVGNTLLDFLFPGLHLANAAGSANNSMYDRFYDDTKLAKCLYSYMSAYPFKSVRTMFFMYGRLHWPTATGFTPMRAKAIYERFCKDGFVVYDSSAGYGGRMLGALTCNKNIKYVCCEPNTETYISLNKLYDAVNETKRMFNIEPSICEIHNCGSEDLKLPSAYVDFAFTCPPYYNLERYCNEPTQSIIKFKKYDVWLEGFVRPTLRNTYNALKPHASMCLVLGNIRSTNNKFYPLIDDWSRIAKEEGFTFVDTYAIKTRSRKNTEDLERLLHFIKE